MTPLYSVKCSDYWTLGPRYEDYMVKVYCYVKRICGAINHSLFTVTPVNPIFPPTKIFLVVAASPDSITKGIVFDKVVFPYLRICIEFSKHLRQVSLNKGMLKWKTFIPTLSKLIRTCRRVLLWSHTTQTYLSTRTLIRSSGCLFLPS